LNDNSGLMLPHDFKPVALPDETRKEIFRDAHRARALAALEADRKVPVDLIKMRGDKPAIDKRMAEHQAIIDGLLETSRAALAKRHNITVADIAKIEDEASRLRWLPPEAPTLEPEAGASNAEGARDTKPEEKPDTPKAEKDTPK